jgi:hypothetical protein
MTSNDVQHGDLPADVPPEEAKPLLALAERLRHDRPVPRASFRGDLRRSLLAEPSMQRPRRLRLLIAGYLAAGSLLLAVPAAGLAGIGPFAPSSASSSTSAPPTPALARGASVPAAPRG